jgi:hypothetical protein
MSETMNASGVQVLEPGLRSNVQATGADGFVGTFIPDNQSGVTWSTVTIGLNPTAMGLAISCTGTPSFSGISGLEIDPSSPIVQFASTTNPETDFVYTTLCDDLITITYLKYSEAHHSEPTATGVWLGTSSGGTVYPSVKA